MKDPFMRHMGIEVEALGPDAARLALTIRPEHANLHGTAHGGLLYALADAAFALISNQGARAVALSTRIDYFRPVAVGTRVRAEAEPVHRGRKVASYRVRLLADDRLVAQFVGTVFHLEEP